MNLKDMNNCFSLIVIKLIVKFSQVKLYFVHYEKLLLFIYLFF